tara:strand:- start:2 stop:805 length:804 start_codon:yes stop_codon:yes gene_type:complete
MGFKLPKQSIIHGTKGHKKAVETAKASPAKGLLDSLQDGLSVAGMIPVVGNIADGANTLLSGGRAAHAKYKGDDKAAAKHTKNMAINATAMIPGIGQAATAGKLALKGGKALTKATKKGIKETTKEEAGKKIAKKSEVFAAKKVGDEAIDKSVQDKNIAQTDTKQPKKESKGKVSYDQAWEKADKSKYASKEEFTKEAKDWNKKQAEKKQTKKETPKKVEKKQIAKKEAPKKEAPKKQKPKTQKPKIAKNKTPKKKDGEGLFSKNKA